MVVYLIANFLFSFYSQNIETISYENAFNRVVENYRDVKSLQYEMFLQNKCFDCDAKKNIVGSVKIIHKYDDSVFKKIFLYECTYLDGVNEKYVRYYNGDKLYSYTDTVHNFSYTEFDPHLGQTSLVTGTHDGKMVEMSDLLNSEVLTKIFNEKSLNVRVIDTFINDTAYILHETKFKDLEQFTQRKRQIFINSNNFLIERVIFSVNFFDQIQIDDYQITQVQINNINSTNLQYEFDDKIKGWKKVVYQPPVRQNFNAGDIVQSFPAKDYISDNLINIEFDNKIVVLDFWYSACLPCVKIIPTLNLLYNKFKSDVYFYAVNLSEDDYQNKKQVDKFLEIAPINYSIVFGDNQLLETFRIYGFPTLYIIQNNELKFIHLGYNPEYDLYSEVDSVLTSLIIK